MSNRSQQGNTNEHDQPKTRVPQKKTVRTAPVCFDLNTAFAPTVLCNNMGKPLCLLNNNPHQEYQKPALTLCKTNPSLHYLLAGLKTAQTFLFLQAQQLSAILPEKWGGVGAAFECCICFPELLPQDAFRAWLALKGVRSLLVGGIELSDNQDGTVYLNLENPYAPDIETSLPDNFFEPLQIAATAYNGAVTMLFDAGFFVCSIHFLGHLFDFESQLQKTGLAVFDI